MASYDWSRMPEFVKAVKAACHDGIAMTAEHVANAEVKKKFSKMGAFTASPVGTPPAIRNGTLRDSIKSAMVAPLVGKVGSTVKYGEVHEFGKHIAARNVRHLRIPLNEAAQRLNASKGLQSLTSLRTFGKFRFFVSKAGNLIAIGQDRVKWSYYKTSVMGKRKQINNNIQPVFLLKPTVNLPARPFMRPALARLAGNTAALAAFVKGATNSLKKSFKKARFT